MKTTEEIMNKNKVHRILVHSYFLYFIFFIIGTCLDVFFRFEIFNNDFVFGAGIVILIFATILIFWAQSTSRNLKTDINGQINEKSFAQGPYFFTSSPTHYGIFFLFIGFGMLASAPFVLLFTLFAFLISKFTFLEKMENALEEKYGSRYAEYRKRVKF